MGSVQLLRDRALFKASGASAKTRTPIAAANGRKAVARVKTARTALQAELRAIIRELGDEEVGVLGLLATRLLEGQRVHGQMRLARDQRDLLVERGDELADALVYTAMSELKRLFEVARRGTR